MQRKRLKSGSIYMCTFTGRIGVLLRRQGVFRRRKEWVIEYIASVLPEELNSQFKTILLEQHEFIGEL